MMDSQKQAYRRHPFAAAKYRGKTIRYYCLATPSASGTEKHGMTEHSAVNVRGTEQYRCGAGIPMGEYGAESPKEEYGVLVTMGDEETAVPSLSVSRRRTEDLLLRMVRGCVTPALTRDVVEDWLAE